MVAAILKKGEPKLLVAAPDPPQETQAASEPTGVLLIADNLDAFAVRALAAREAKHSLDLMYYLWYEDSTGKLLIQEAIKAADRGVRVRMLIDDINPRDNDQAYLALDSHPNISVRLFNPSWLRIGKYLRRVEFCLRMRSLTRRMHNKAWIADGELAIIGGRNIGDPYFDASETNFRDLDALLRGPAVAKTAEIFESFWNCPAARPIGQLSRPRLSKMDMLHALTAIETNLSGAHVTRTDKRGSLPNLIREKGGMHWTENVVVVSDPPDKVRGKSRQNWLMKMILPIIMTSKNSLEIISPYFVPGAGGVSVLAELVNSGIAVSILTNSLAATDVVAVHGAYAKYRPAILKLGIKLFELQPRARKEKTSVFGSKGASLHTKAFTVDDQVAFIGSFNFDPRSASLNTEMGALFTHPSLIADMRKRFTQEIAGHTSYRLSLKGARVAWEGEVDGKKRKFAGEPEAGLGRKLLALLIRFLPIESQL
jgi:putative cardiolipin synthase